MPLRVHTLPVGMLQANCYVIEKDGTAVLVDPGADAAKIRSFLDKKGLTAKAVLLTHGHGDHIEAVRHLGLPVYVHADDEECLYDAAKNLSGYAGMPFAMTKGSVSVTLLADGDTVPFSGDAIRVIHTPGHTKGGVCYLFGNLLFSGDTLFCRSVGRSDFPGGSHAQLMRSIESKLLTLPDETEVYPGHGPSSTIGSEKKCNPFFDDDDGHCCP
jgi:glyoxylase-like metal-dependent hydrolase (beta-lactamase superfamily II)